MRRSKLLLVGLSHHSAPIEVREKVAVSSDELGLALGDLVTRPGVEEAVVVSTCNRLEIYAAASADTAADAIGDWLHRRHPGAAGHLYVAREGDAVRHLFRVCSSLDSMVVGESQILGQVKDAFRAGEEAGTVGGLLRRVMHKAFAVAKRVRTETQIGAAAVSMGSAGVEVARKVLGPLEGLSALVVGAGEIGGLAARSLLGAGCTDLHVVNRSRERGEALAAEVGATYHPWDELGALLVRCDLIFTTTAAQVPVITLELVQEARRRRRHRPLVLVDLALPRDVDPRVNELAEVYVFDVDDLDRVLEENRAARAREAAVAEGLVEREARSFFAALQSEAEPLIKELHQRAEAIVQAELERSMRHGFTQEQRESMAALGRAIARKILHQPTVRIRQAGLEDDGALLGAAAALFGLEFEEAAATPGRAAAAQRPAQAKEEAKEAASPSLVARGLAFSRSGNS